jgi:putative methionine-R-sulfoxide reductase with GAF domain
MGGQKKVLGSVMKKSAVESEWSQTISDSQGKKKGRISIQSRLVEAFTDSDKRLIEKVASELGVLWRR